MKRSFRMLIGLWLSLPFSSPVVGEDWSQWRGTNRDGKSSETGLLKTWPEGGPKLLWQVQDLGNGYSTPSVSGNQLFVLSNQGTDKEEVISLSVKDGKRLWATTIGKVGPNQGPQYPGTRSTPTISEGKLYCLGSDGDLVCLEAATGKMVWGKNLRSDFDGVPGMWAYTESPLIDGNALICSPGGTKSTVVALNKGTGEKLWSTSLPEGDAASYASPIVTTVDGTKQYVLYLGKGVVGLNASSGELLWRYAKTSDSQANIATPVVQGNKVYSAASRVGGGLVEVGSKKGEPKEVYFAKTLPSGMGGSVLVNGKLYGTAGPAMMCVDYATGNVVWQDRGIGSASICFADGRLYLHGDNNEIAMIEATDSGWKLLGKGTPPNAPARGNSKAWAHPVISDGKLYIRDQSSIWCYDIRG